MYINIICLICLLSVCNNRLKSNRVDKYQSICLKQYEIHYILLCTCLHSKYIFIKRQLPTRYFFAKTFSLEVTGFFGLKDLHVIDNSLAHTGKQPVKLFLTDDDHLVLCLLLMWCKYSSPDHFHYFFCNFFYKYHILLEMVPIKNTLYKLLDKLFFRIGHLLT